MSNSKNERSDTITELRVQLPKSRKTRAVVRAKKLGFTSLSSYVRFLIYQDLDK